MTISTRRLSDVLASTESGRLYRIEVFLRAEEPGAAALQADAARPDAARPNAARYIHRTTEGELVLPLDRNRYRLKSGEVLTALAPPLSDL
ncbi:6-phosphofructokinase [Achromobacter xylosoxidans]|uniref:6-phosphofructokinase n=1 Tax=Alcaligenes xylosoxydans xylosoxydans TaxID=85698 RepID=A0A424WG43_ALCXX|nr:6-phosphofructokinase [Achromobacter xylosoxidans]MBC9905418.1 6-phosphofructokinase [Achromobacter xylosoxidans]MBD0869008.1 6-phosphofructokinase [Achromobacter xylosoxidans]QNP84172.1 6-phosphofructokinase [Achromobacter xylosoxidans]RPJ92213.1 6-phosphofructokinase [Achromobacter xylosoxidans]